MVQSTCVALPSADAGIIVGSAMEAAGTCRTLQKAEKELGADIGVWLMAPRPHSRLGDR